MTIKFTMPTPERCTQLGINYEGLYTRTKLWLLGYASAIAAVDAGKLTIIFGAKNTFTVEVNYDGAVLKGIADGLTRYGCTMEEETSTTSAKAFLPVGCLTNDGKLVTKSS